jgi:hypothetical protein
MDLRKQLHDVLYARVLFTLAVLTAVLWVQIEDHGPRPEELGVALAVILLVNVPFFLLEKRVETRTLTGAMVVVDILLVTAGIVYSGGALSSAGVFYVWPIVLSTVFLPAWVPYAAAAASGAAYAGVWWLQRAEILSTAGMVTGYGVPSTWMLISVSLHVAAFLLIALLAGRLATALVKGTVEISAAKTDTEAQLRRMKATNDQLHLMSESSRVFLRHHEVDALMPEALNQIAGASGLKAGFALIRNHHTGELDEKAKQGPVDAVLIEKMKALGLAEFAAAGARQYEEVTDTRVGRLLKAVEKQGFRGLLLAPLEAKNELLGLVCLLYRQDEAIAESAVPTLRALCDQVALVVRNIQYNEELAQKNDELTHLDQLKSDFMATMSHELRTPLTSIIGYSDMLLSGMTG